MYHEINIQAEEQGVAPCGFCDNLAEAYKDINGTITAICECGHYTKYFPDEKVELWVSDCDGICTIGFVKTLNKGRNENGNLAKNSK